MSRKQVLTLWLAWLGLGICTFVAVIGGGSSLSAPAAVSGFGGAGGHHGLSALARTLLGLATIMGVSQVLGRLSRHVGQPAVMGEVLGGILLGPSFLGWLAPGLQAQLFQADAVAALSVLAKVGVILYMFFVGLELDPATLRNQGPATVLISHASIVLPFSLGSLLTLYLYPRYGFSDVPLHVFTLFLGASMSVTAFPVLARILTDLNLQKTRLGVMALTCAAVDDVTAWCILATVVSVAAASATLAVQTLGLTLAFVLLMIFVARPFILRLVEAESLGGVLLLVVLSACATEAIGIHALFGAFLLGAIIPHDSKLAQRLMQNLWNLVSILLLPCFFAFTGLRTEIGLVQGADWIGVILIVACACIGKFGGTFVAARMCKLSTREAAALAILMNTRGLMELVVLNLGLELKILSPLLFTMFVLMAVLTTFATTPILQWIRSGDPLASARAA